MRYSRRTPGDVLFHPVVLLALAVVILNDRVLKGVYPGPITGKLSDFAGLVYFPLFVVACFEAARWVVWRRSWELGPRSVEMVCVVIGVVFVLIKTWGPAADVYRSALGFVLWPAYVLGDLVQGRGLPDVRRFDVVEDRSDLVALVALMVPVWVARRVMAQPVRTAVARQHRATNQSGEQV